MAGPFHSLPIPNLRISPIGSVPKKDGGIRIITHLSYPEGNSVNSFIDPELASVQYSSFDQVVEIVSNLGKGALMGKMDIKSAFRLIPVSPSDFDLFGIHFNDQYFIDKCLPFGCSMSCNVFEKFSSFLHWLTVQKSNLQSMEHSLDDFFFAGLPNSDQCYRLMSCFESICAELQVPLADDKKVGPVTSLTFLGLQIDTINMQVRVPQPKRDELEQLLISLSEKKKVTLRELQSLLGSLSFLSRAVSPGRAFIRRLYDATAGITKPHHHIRVTTEMRDDMNMWLTFLRTFDGNAYFPDSVWSSNDTLEFFTDSAAAESLGCGAFYAGNWVAFAWPEAWYGTDIMKDITFLELVPLFLALLIWGSELANKKVLFRIDNMALVSIINRKTSKSKRVMQFLRHFVLLTLQHNIIFKSKHISTLQNATADAISRFQFTRFRRLEPNASPNPAQVPAEFLALISTVKSNV